MKYRSTIGIEIVTGEVRAACVRTIGNSALLAGVTTVPLQGAGVDSEGFLDSGAVGEAIRRAAAQLDPRAADVAMGLTDCSLVVRVFDIPPVADTEVRSVLRGEMDHYRILPPDQSAFDFYRLPESPDKEAAVDETPTSRVLLIGVEERIVASYRAAADNTTLNLVAVEPGAIAAMRALHPTMVSERALASIVVSATGTDVVIAQEGGLQFYRRIDTGVSDLTLSRGTADGAGQDVPARGTMLGESGPAFDEPAPRSDEKYNRQAVSVLMTEVQRSIDFFKREYPSCGGKMRVVFTLSCDQPGEVFAMFREYLRSEAELAAPFSSVPTAPEIGEHLVGPGALRYTVPVGLALRAAGGEFALAPSMDLTVGDRVIADRKVAPRLMLASALVTGVVLLGTVAAALLVLGRIGAAERSLAQTKHELTALAQEHAEQISRLEKQKVLAEAIAATNKPMREGVEFLSASISSRACLNSVNISKSGHIFLSGEAMSPYVVADIIDTINLSPMLEPVRVDSITRLEDVGKHQVVGFQMHTGFLATGLGTAPQPTTAPEPVASSEDVDTEPTPEPAPETAKAVEATEAGGI